MSVLFLAEINEILDDNMYRKYLAQQSCTITPIVTDFYKEIECNSKIHTIFSGIGKRTQ